MKKVILSLAVVFTLGMVSCGNSNKADEQVPEEVGVVEEVDTTIVETPQGEIEAAAVEGEAAVENVGNAAAQTVNDVKEKSSNKVQEAKEKAQEAVSNAADKAADKAGEVIDNAAEKVSDAAQSAADKMKSKFNRTKNN